MRVEPSLYEVIQESIAFSRSSGGKFDVTIAPLLRAWKEAHAEGRQPSATEIARASRCVGYEKIEVQAPDRIRFRSDCVELDLGGIGKGYAVDRAMAVLKAAGILRAMVNAGGSSIVAIGAPPGLEGWPVRLGARVSGREILLLRDGVDVDLSAESRRARVRVQRVRRDSRSAHGSAGPEPHGRQRVAPTATMSDALDTALVMLSTEDGAKLLSGFADVAALWISAAGELGASYGESRLQLADLR